MVPAAHARPTVSRVSAARGSPWGWLCPGPLRAVLPHQHSMALVHTGSRKQGRCPPCKPQQRDMRGKSCRELPPLPSPDPCGRILTLCPAQTPNHPAHDGRMLSCPSSISLSFGLLSCHEGSSKIITISQEY